MKKAFTLMELLIVVIIISILAGMSVLYGAKPTEVAKAKAAEAILQAIYTAEKEYCIHLGFYAPLGAPGVAGTLIGERYLDNPHINADQRDWTYSTDPPGASSGPNDCGTFIARATRQRGPNVGEQITIDETGQIDTTGWNP